jgi:hypothetical protein
LIHSLNGFDQGGFYLEPYVIFKDIYGPVIFMNGVEARVGGITLGIANVHEHEILAQSMMGKRVLTLFWLL